MELIDLLQNKEAAIEVAGKKTPLPPKGRLVYPNKWWPKEQVVEYWMAVGVDCICGHSVEAHSGHIYSPPNPAPTNCSQGCGCKAYQAKFDHYGTTLG